MRDYRLGHCPFFGTLENSGAWVIFRSDASRVQHPSESTWQAARGSGHVASSFGSRGQGCVKGRTIVLEIPRMKTSGIPDLVPNWISFPPHVRSPWPSRGCSYFQMVIDDEPVEFRARPSRFDGNRLKNFLKALALGRAEKSPVILLVTSDIEATSGLGFNRIGSDPEAGPAPGLGCLPAGPPAKICAHLDWNLLVTFGGGFK